MDVRRWSTLQETFDRLVDLQPDDQNRVLREMQENDPFLASEVRELLDEDAAGRELPEMNVESLLQNALRGDNAELPAEGQIGPYRILSLLGEGGMGVVYLAERTDIAGPVAIKLLRDAWLSPVRRQRFAVEQQMLGLLKHPAIARIYDAGTTTEGTPWFVMEFSDGVPITDSLRGRNLTGREILKLVGSVCETVRYAHSLAIIHRDLKPSNILVRETGEIKLLDFGIAKQMDMVNLGSTVTTAGFRLFTPAYAAPELQIENRVGVFTDIYSMGVILYELLTGTLPFADGVIGDRDPQRPSRAKTFDGRQDVISLSKSEWADVDSICMKALERRSEDRYASMDALISDIDNFLSERPVSSRNRAVLYTARKFLYRNRLPVIAVTVGLAILIAATILFTVRLARARDAATSARDAADRARDAAAIARDQAVAEAARSARLQRFSESLFTGGEKSNYPPPSIKVTEMLDRGRSEAVQIVGDPRLQAAMFASVGTAYESLGHYADAQPLLRKAQIVLCSGAKTLRCADVEDALVELLLERDGGPEMITLAQDALRIKQKALQPDDPELANAFLSVGYAEHIAGDERRAVEAFDEALKVASASGRPNREWAFALDWVAQFDFPYNDPRALADAQKSAEMNRKLFGTHSFEFARSEATIGQILLNYGKYPDAELYLRSALQSVQAWSGPEEPITVRYAERLGEVLVQEGKLPETQAIFTHALAIVNKSPTPSANEQGDAYFNLGFVQLQKGDLTGAEGWFDRVLALKKQHLSVSLTNLEFTELGLGMIYDLRGDYGRAETTIRQGIPFKTAYGATGGHAVLGDILLHQGKPREAEGELRAAYEWFSHDSTMRPQTAMTYFDLAKTEELLGKPEEAARIRNELQAHPK